MSKYAQALFLGINILSGIWLGGALFSFITFWGYCGSNPLDFIFGGAELLIFPIFFIIEMVLTFKGPELRKKTALTNLVLLIAVFLIFNLYINPQKIKCDENIKKNLHLPLVPN